MANPEQINIEPLIGPYTRQRQATVRISEVRNNKIIKQVTKVQEAVEMSGPYTTLRDA